MKNIFYIIIASLFMYSCNRDCEFLGNYIFTEEQLQYVPYELNENVTFTTSAGDTLTGIVTKKNVKREKTKENSTCNYIIQELISSTITFNENHRIRINLTNNQTPITFFNGFIKDGVEVIFVAYDSSSVEKLIFNTITLNNLTFENSLLLTKRNIDNITDRMVYSKTNGIEFILFEDGSWYKRLEE